MKHNAAVIREYSLNITVWNISSFRISGGEEAIAVLYFNLTLFQYSILKMIQISKELFRAAKIVYEQLFRLCIVRVNPGEDRYIWVTRCAENSHQSVNLIMSRWCKPLMWTSTTKCAAENYARSKVSGQHAADESIKTLKFHTMIDETIPTNERKNWNANNSFVCFHKNDGPIDEYNINKFWREEPNAIIAKKNSQTTVQLNSKHAIF